MGGRNEICLRITAETLNGRGDLRHVEKDTQTLIKYWAVDSIYATQGGKKWKIFLKNINSV